MYYGMFCQCPLGEGGEASGCFAFPSPMSDFAPSLLHKVKCPCFSVHTYLEFLSVAATIASLVLATLLTTTYCYLLLPGYVISKSHPFFTKSVAIAHIYTFSLCQYTNIPPPQALKTFLRYFRIF